VKLSKIIQLAANTSLITRAIYIPLNISINFKLVTATALH